MGGAVAALSRARVVHTIVYRFEEPVTMGETPKPPAQPAQGASLSLRLTPRALAEQRVDHHQILITPRPATTVIGDDENGNVVQRVELLAPLRTIEIQAVSSVARMVPRGDDGWRQDALDLLARSGVLPADPPFPERPRDGREACRLRAEMILERLRAREIPCRYVAGYPWPARRGRTLPHAWISLHMDGHGWVDFDGLSGEVAPGHVTLGWGSCYEDVAPVSGSLRAKGRYRLVSTVVVEPLASG